MSQIETAAAGKVGGVSGRVDIKLAGGKQPVVLAPTFVNGEGPYDFVLDTGAGTCLIVPELAGELGIVAARTTRGMGAAGAVTIGFGAAGSIAVGRARVSGLEIGITSELYRIASAVGAPIHGALGFPFLSRFRVTVDYGARLLELSESGESSAGFHAQEARIEFQLAAAQKPLILIPAWLNGRGPYQFALDTGASTTVISSETARELGIAGSPIPNVMGGGGAIPALAARLGSIRIGTAVASDLAVLILEALSTLSAALGTRLDGILGYNFLRGFSVAIDYPQRVVALRSGPAPAGKPSASIAS
jgi:predicted aspartyl protease